MKRYGVKPFLVLSLCLHSFLLIEKNFSKRDQSVASTLTPIEISFYDEVTKKTQLQTIKKRRHVRPKKVSQEIRSKQSARKLKQATTLKEQYLAIVRHEILKNKHYPRMAKRLKQQGKVIVEFVILKNGGIQNIRLIQPSEYEKLNQASLSAIEKIKGAIPPFPQEIDQNQMKVRLPIDFLLI